MTSCGKEVSVRGRLIRIARIAEGYEFVENPQAFAAGLRDSGGKADIFTFIQRLSDTTPRFDYLMEWDNLAAVRVSSFDQWFSRQINRKTRNIIRKAEKCGVVVREVPFDEELVLGIKGINDETPVRQGRPFWHYRSDVEAVRRANGSFHDRSIFLGAFLGDALIGYAKLTRDESDTQAGLMQIVSMVCHRDKAPNNLLVAQAVRSCAERGIRFLWYARLSYRNKGLDSLAEFKLHNGFERVDIPRYYVPISAAGRFALRFGLQHGLDELIPRAFFDKTREFRNRWYVRRQGRC